MDTIDVEYRYSTAYINTPARTGALNTIVRYANAWVDSVEILFAPGHAALTGVALTYGGLTILPWEQPGQFIVGDNVRLLYAIGMYMPGPITIITHNNDGFVHGHYLTFKWHTYRPPALSDTAQPLTVIA